MGGGASSEEEKSKTSLTLDECAHLAGPFWSADVADEIRLLLDKDGKIATTKFVEVANKYGFEMDADTIHKSNSKLLSSDEIWSKNIDKLFKNLDKNKDGQIEIAEIKRYLRKCCGQTKEQSRDAAKYLLSAFDKDGGDDDSPGGDRLISREEFFAHFDEMHVESAKKGIAHALQLYNNYRNRRESSAEDVAALQNHLLRVQSIGKEKHEVIRKERVKRIASQRSMRLAEERESDAATAATSADTEKKSTEADGQLETKKDETTDHTDDKESKTEATAAAATAPTPITVEAVAETEQKAENEKESSETKKDDAPSTPMPAPAVPVETPAAAKETDTPTPAPASSPAADEDTKTETSVAAADDNGAQPHIDDLMPPDFQPETEDIPDHNFRVGDCVQCRFKKKWYAAEIRQKNKDGTYKCRFLRYNYIISKAEYGTTLRLVAWPLMPRVVHGLKKYLTHIRKKLSDKNA